MGLNPPAARNPRRSICEVINVRSAGDSEWSKESSAIPGRPPIFTGNPCFSPSTCQPDRTRLPIFARWAGASIRRIFRTQASAAAGPTPSVQKVLEMKDRCAASIVAAFPMTAPMGNHCEGLGEDGEIRHHPEFPVDSPEEEPPPDRNFIENEPDSVPVASFADALEETRFGIRVAGRLHHDGGEFVAMVRQDRVEFVEPVVVEGQGVSRQRHRHPGRIEPGEEVSVQSIATERFAARYQSCQP